MMKYAWIAKDATAEIASYYGLVKVYYYQAEIKRSKNQRVNNIGMFYK